MIGGTSAYVNNISAYVSNYQLLHFLSKIRISYNEYKYANIILKFNNETSPEYSLSFSLSRLKTNSFLSMFVLDPKFASQKCKRGIFYKRIHLIGGTLNIQDVEKCVDEIFCFYNVSICLNWCYIIPYLYGGVQK